MDGRSRNRYRNRDLRKSDTFSQILTTLGWNHSSKHPGPCLQRGEGRAKPWLNPHQPQRTRRDGYRWLWRQWDRIWVILSKFGKYTCSHFLEILSVGNPGIVMPITAVCSVLPGATVTDPDGLSKSRALIHTRFSDGGYRPTSPPTTSSSARFLTRAAADQPVAGDSVPGMLAGARGRGRVHEVGGEGSFAMPFTVCIGTSCRVVFLSLWLRIAGARVHDGHKGPVLTSGQ